MRNNIAGSFGIFLIAALLLAPGFVSGVTLKGSVKFARSLHVGGQLQKTQGTFVIDHPLDPRNKLLFHSFVESPDIKNIYDGIATLDEKGEAVIELPEYFDALNRDFRYQFFPLDKAEPGLYLKEGAEATKNRFTLAGGTPGSRVSWQITGIRHDPFVQAHPIIVEVEKGDDALVKKGEYLFEGYAKP